MKNLHHTWLGNFHDEGRLLDHLPTFCRAQLWSIYFNITLAHWHCLLVRLNMKVTMYFSWTGNKIHAMYRKKHWVDPSDHFFFFLSSYQCFYMIKILLSYKIGAFFWHALPRMGKKLKIIMVRQLYNFLRKENEWITWELNQDNQHSFLLPPLLKGSMVKAFNCTINVIQHIDHQ